MIDQGANSLSLQAAMPAITVLLAAICGLAVAPASAQAQSGLTALSRERLVLQTQYGDLHLAFYPQVRSSIGG